MTKGVHGPSIVLAPASVFESWTGDDPDAPKSFVGIADAGGTSIAVFHDPDDSFAIPHQGTVLLVSSSYGSEKLEAQLAALPSEPWKRLDGTYRSDGGEHVLFVGMYSASQYNDADMIEEIAAETGLPVRITIPAGDYALEEYGMWRPASDSEYSLTRLVPTGSRPAAKAAAAKKKPAAAKKKPAAAEKKPAAAEKKPAAAKKKPAAAKKRPAAKKKPVARKQPAKKKTRR